MGNLGRIVCVAIPFILASISLVCLLVSGLTGVAGHSLFMFEVNMTNFQIASSSVANLIDKAISGRSADMELAVRMVEVRDDLHSIRLPASPTSSSSSADTSLHSITLPDTPSSKGKADTSLHDFDLLGLGSSSGSSSSGTTGLTSAATSSDNITAPDLGLENLYQVGVWGYCYVTPNNTRKCSKPKFNWAADVINITTGDIDKLVTGTGSTIELPKTITKSLKAFETVTRITEIVFLVAYISSAIQLLIGLFTSCSRVISCLTWMAALLTVVTVCAAAALATAMSVIIVGAVEATAKFYGVTASLNKWFLALVWLGAATAIIASVFWFATICCCKPEHRRNRRHNMDGHSAYNLPRGGGAGAYHPIGAEETGYMSGAKHSGPSSFNEKSRSNEAYEPYKHTHANV